ncbi:MAG: 4a-hydroxytetrahydrobiopterin dehydratase [Acidimicrobiaceae bacterium]|nr:4a-hydroxytetrahydrobiopterin dehydratase [Acidimicrobiaceae bacterium]MDQ1420782.1 4a-hydroxytetrahydrobiopterin dehydratase [Acidimicrobiaceae bacterium]
MVCRALRREAGGVPERLSDDEVTAGLAGLQWDRDGDELVKVVTRKDFGEAMQFVNAVALLAEGANHHPDIAISWNRVTLRVTTHDAGGLSRMDMDLAAAIDDLG